MRSSVLSAALLPVAARGLNIVSSNDDGWAEINIRELWYSLESAGHNVIISAPAENKSGSGSLTGTPSTLSEPCEFNSCPSGSPAEGSNSSEPAWNYVNSYPATAIQYGIDTLAPQFWEQAPDLAVTGPNVGANLGLECFFSGTVGAAVEAVNMGVPAIAFSGLTGDQTAWNVAEVPSYATIYAALAEKVVAAVIESGTPYLPTGTFLNVNFPTVSDTECTSVDDFKFVLSRIDVAIPLISGADAVTCNNNARLPTETKVVDTDGCYAAISVGSTDKTTADQADQTVVLNKIQSLLTCLP